MALFQSAAAKGQEATPSTYQAGIVTTAIYTYTFAAAFTAATDKIEFGRIPAYVQIVNAVLVGSNLGGATNAVLGVMTGDPGDPSDTRTVQTDAGNQVFGATAVNSAVATATLAQCLSIPRSDKHRALGATLSADVTAGSTKTLTLRIDYVA
jgi:hypothetical protein